MVGRAGAIQDRLRADLTDDAATLGPKIGTASGSVALPISAAPL